LLGNLIVAGGTISVTRNSFRKQMQQNKEFP